MNQAAQSNDTKLAETATRTTTARAVAQLADAASPAKLAKLVNSETATSPGGKRRAARNGHDPAPAPGAASPPAAASTQEDAPATAPPSATLTALGIILTDDEKAMIAAWRAEIDAESARENAARELADAPLIQLCRRWIKKDSAAQFDDGLVKEWKQPRNYYEDFSAIMATTPRSRPGALAMCKVAIAWYSDGCGDADYALAALEQVVRLG
jgi:hypothetical protein